MNNFLSLENTTQLQYGFHVATLLISLGGHGYTEMLCHQIGPLVGCPGSIFPPPELESRLLKRGYMRDYIGSTTAAIRGY